MTTAAAREEFDDSAKGVLATSGAAFGAVMLITAGLFQILQGIAAILRNQIYLTGADYVYAFDVSAWGWIHLVMGIIAVAVAVGVLRGATWGIVAGIVVGGLAALTNFAFIPYYPFWSLIILAFNVFVIWSLCSLLVNRTDG